MPAVNIFKRVRKNDTRACIKIIHELIIQRFQNSVGEVVGGSIIERNSAALGGGIFTADAGIALVADSSIIGNSAQVPFVTFFTKSKNNRILRASYFSCCSF